MKSRVQICAVLVLMSTGAALAAARFTDNGDGTVTDSRTGLMWQQQDDATVRTWENALAYCEGLSLAGHTDWRLPNVRELTSIVDNARYSPAIDTTLFPVMASDYYWSSSSGADLTSFAWLVGFGNGSVGYGNKTDNRYARCVRL